MFWLEDQKKSLLQKTLVGSCFSMFQHDINETVCNARKVNNKRCKLLIMFYEQFSAN